MDGGRHNVIIVGGGIAGCATAIALASRGVDDVVVIDRARQPDWRIGETVPPTIRLPLERLDLWNDFLSQRHLPSAGTCASWGKAELGYNDFLLDGQGKGWHLDRAAFDRLLADAVSARGGTIMPGRRLRDVVQSSRDGYVLEFDSDDGSELRLEAGFLVDATGIAASAVRRLGVARNQVDCLAVVSAVLALDAADAVPTQALLEACEHGWWYAAKLPGDRMITALAIDPSEQKRFGEPDTFMSAVRQTRNVSQWLTRGGADLDDGNKLTLASAPSAILSRVTGERWLAVGDAASAYDPISSHGIVKALSDGEAAAKAIATYLTGAGEPPLIAYQDGVFARFSDYLRLHQQLYRRERRWPQSPFWQHRLLVREPA